MHGMSDGQTGRFEAKPGKERIGLDDSLQCRRHRLHTAGGGRGDAIPEERLVAELREAPRRERGRRRFFALWTYWGARGIRSRRPSGWRIGGD